MGASSSKDASPDWSSTTSLSELEWQQMPDSGSAKGMLEIMPADDLVFPFETFKDAVCCMTLKNTTAYYDVAYWIQTTRPERYRIQNNISIVSPWSSATVNVIMVAQNEAPPDMECKDKFLVRSAALKDDTTIKGLNRNMFEIDPAYVVDCVKLGVVLKPRPQETDVMVFRPPTRDGVDIQLQDTGSTLHHMTLQHLKEITNNFSNEGIIGRGGFGVVYKGVLGNGKIVAVKKLVQSMSSSQEQFENEVTILMKLKHPNIVRLLGYCYETQHLRNIHKGKSIFAENTECLLCLECLPKGSLEKYISGASKMEKCARKCTRVYIARNRLPTNKKMHSDRSNMCES